MNNSEIKKVLADHKMRLEDHTRGERAGLSCANLFGAALCGANLSDADLTGAALCGANLSDANLSGADLHQADLRRADLSHADLSHANLSGANLRGADLDGVKLRGANLTGANIDYSAWPLGCCSLDVKVDKRIAAQLLYHALRAMQSCADEPDVAEVLASEACLRLANQFHRADECGRIEPPKKKGDDHDK